MTPTRGPATFVVTVVFTVLSSIVVTARICTRSLLVRKVQQDDWWIVAAWTVAVAFSSSICIGVAHGLGKHSQDISDVDRDSLKKAEYSFLVLYNPALMLTKTSIIICYLSVMTKTTDQVFKWLNYLTLAIINVSGIALTLYNIFQCTPVPAAFTYPTPHNAKCTDIVTLYLSSAPVNIITDLATLFLPMPILTSIKIPRKQKIVLIITFGFGGFVAIVDVIRLAYFQNAFSARLSSSQSKATGQHPVEENDDFSWYAALSFMWCAVEVNLGIICASIPHLKPLFTRFLPCLVIDSPTWSQPGRGASTPIATASTHRFSNGTKPSTMTRGRETSHEPLPPSFQRRSQRSADDSISLISRRPVSTFQVNDNVPSQHSSYNLDLGINDSPKGMLEYSHKESLRPVAVVTVVFFMWGFAYGLLDSINRGFQQIAGLSTSQSLGLHAAYYTGYLFGPLTLGRFILKRYGFKASMITGLVIYGCGSLVFWPSAVLTSFKAFIFANFIVGFGLSCLEISANPYVALCGPPENSATRLNLSQAFQAMGTVSSTVIATKVLLHSRTSLINTQWAYLGIALFAFSLTIGFYYFPIPEVTDAELGDLARQKHEVYDVRIGRYKVVYATLAIGVLSQWCYVGVQECIGLNTISLLTALKPNLRPMPVDFDMIGLSLFATGRIVAALMNVCLRPRHVLLVLYTCLVATLGTQVAVSGLGTVIAQLLLYFFEGGIFSTIFAICLAGLGVHTKTGSAFMTSAISGGALLPFVQWAVANNSGLRTSYCVPLAAAVAGMIFAIYLNLVPAARIQVDEMIVGPKREITKTIPKPVESESVFCNVRAKDMDRPSSTHVELHQRSSESGVEFRVL